MTEKREYTDDYPEKTLYLPGPTEVREDVIEAMAEPMFGHRMDRMTDLYTTIVEDTREFLDTDQNVIVLTASGTEFWEATTLNLVEDRMLVPTSGSFSERQANVAERLGKAVDRIEYDWGKAVKPEDVREALEASDEGYDAVGMVMNETSTGVRNPVEEVGDLLGEYPDTYFVVDAISCLGGDYVVPEEHNIDALFTSSQKAFAMPPGLAITTVSEDAYERELAKDSASWYGGFQRCLDYYDRKGQTHSTPAIPLMLAYRKQMKHMLDEGHKARDQRHREMAEYTREWAREHFGLYAEEGYRSQTVTAVQNTQGIDVAATIEDVSEGYDLVFSNGYGSIGEETFRIGHMGEHTVESVKELTDAIEDVAGL
ncbi:pyridoxal-phosphate-dependent aminotransferase family protein [Halapricum desulfuricans]|uniref:Serine-pyruvate aminotransferase/archaeal aspartate aminotransferase n=1 Tax=Halapricum desulfuricans TaxID=2841257 RepID=A0A897NS07_9EURY|nr:alanine--glyoxylate aminotransferase family protein [Halapricum desulfuricans]QSG15021.1 Serine-pyruvate aminotransferase/archaeal aspartate aminotransferase [Halapricum desulfuricans]